MVISRLRELSYRPGELPEEVSEAAVPFGADGACADNSCSSYNNSLPSWLPFLTAR